MDTGISQFIPQSPAFYTGAALVALYQTSNFAQIGRADIIADRYTSALGGVQASDFTDRRTYRISLFSFVVASLAIYYFACRFPVVLQGLGTVFQVSVQIPWLKDENVAPLYIAILMVGASQPFVPVIPRFFEWLRTFFQDQADVPEGLNKEIDSWLSAIRAHALEEKNRHPDNRLADRQYLSAVIADLRSDEWLEFRSKADTRFFDQRCQAVQADRETADMSTKDLHLLLEDILTIAAVALMRRSGPDFEIIRKRIVAEPAKPGTASELSYLWGSVFLFLLLTVAIWQAIALLNVPVAYVTGTLNRNDFWPDDVDIAFKDVLLRVPNALGPLLLTLYLWRRTFGAAPRLPRRRLNFVSLWGYIENISAYSRILFWCIPLGMLIGALVGLYDYATATRPPNLDAGFFWRKLQVLFMQSMVALPACYALVVTLEAGKAGDGRNLWRASLFVLLWVAGISFVFANTHLKVDLLQTYGYLAPGTEYVLLTVFGSVTMLVGAFLSIAVYIHRSTFTPPEEADASLAAGPVATGGS